METLKISRLDSLMRFGEMTYPEIVNVIGSDTMKAYKEMKNKRRGFPSDLCFLGALHRLWELHLEGKTEKEMKKSAITEEFGIGHAVLKDIDALTFGCTPFTFSQAIDLKELNRINTEKKQKPETKPAPTYEEIIDVMKKLKGLLLDFSHVEDVKIVITEKRVTETEI